MDWSLIVSIVAPVVTAALVFAGTRRTASASETTAETGALAAAIAPYRDLAEDLRSARSEVDTLRDEVRRVARRLDDVEHDRDTLAEVVTEVIAWEDAGRLDPPGAPSIPVRVRRLVSTLHTTT